MKRIVLLLTGILVFSAHFSFAEVGFILDPERSHINVDFELHKGTEHVTIVYSYNFGDMRQKEFYENVVTRLYDVFKKDGWSVKQKMRPEEGWSGYSIWLTFVEEDGSGKIIGTLIQAFNSGLQLLIPGTTYDADDILSSLHWVQKASKERALDLLYENALSGQTTWINPDEMEGYYDSFPDSDDWYKYPVMPNAE